MTTEILVTNGGANGDRKLYIPGAPIAPYSGYPETSEPGLRYMAGLNGKLKNFLLGSSSERNDEIARHFSLIGDEEGVEVHLTWRAANCIAKGVVNGSSSQDYLIPRSVKPWDGVDARFRVGVGKMLSDYAGLEGEQLIIPTLADQESVEVLIGGIAVTNIIDRSAVTGEPVSSNYHFERR